MHFYERISTGGLLMTAHDILGNNRSRKCLDLFYITYKVGNLLNVSI